MCARHGLFPTVLVFTGVLMCVTHGEDDGGISPLDGFNSTSGNFSEYIGQGNSEIKAMQIIYSGDPQNVTEQECINYLEEYGYLDPESRAKSHRREAVDQAIKRFQECFRLPVTGELDIGTRTAMATVRCGLPDFDAGQEDAHSRRKRYAIQGPKWDTNELNYIILNHYPPFGERHTAALIELALQRWAAVTPLTFTRRYDFNRKNHLSFLFAAGDHGDLTPFDGRGGVLAHAAFPPAGYIHFDGDEDFIYNYYLPRVAAHEIGHALGLAHSTNPDAIMFPTFTQQQTNADLHPDDIRGIQAIYGFQEICVDPMFDAFTHIEVRGQEFAFGFRADTMYKFVDDKIQGKYPISQISPRPTRISAALALFGRIYILGYQHLFPIEISDYGEPWNSAPVITFGPGIPTINIDAAMVWTNNRIYLFSGNQYYRLNEDGTAPDRQYPLSISLWGLPDDIYITAASNGRRGVDFFSDYLHFRVVVRNRRFVVEEGFPKLIANQWFSCQK